MSNSRVFFFITDRQVSTVLCLFYKPKSIKDSSINYIHQGPHIHKNCQLFKNNFKTFSWRILSKAHDVNHLNWKDWLALTVHTWKVESLWEEVTADHIWCFWGSMAFSDWWHSGAEVGWKLGKMVFDWMASEVCLIECLVPE